MSIQIQGGDESDSSGGFKFEEVDFQPATLKELNFKVMLKLLWAKWGLDQCSYLKKFTFDEFFSKHQLDVFLKDFFSSAQVQSSLKVATSRTAWAPVGPISKASALELTCSVTNMEFFEKLKEMGVMVSDELRKLLVCEDCEHYEEFTPAERNEFLFHLFQRLQYEDEIKAYLDMTKSLYKDLVTSLAYQLTSVDTDSFSLFPQCASERFCTCYFIIEPLDRHVTVWYQAHLPPF